MIRRWMPLLAILVTTFGGASTANAQLGPLLDWIHEMSGPKFFQWGTTISLGYQPGLELKLEPFNELRDAVSRMTAQFDTAARASTDALVQRAQTYAGAARYRAVLIDEFNAELKRLTKDIGNYARQGTVDSMVIGQLERRISRLPAFLSRLDSTDALDRGNGIRGRLAITGGSSARSAKQKDPDTAAVNIISISPTAEYLFSHHFAFETGIGIHHFFGDIEPFWSVSLPLLVVARPLVTNDSRFLRSLRINFGANIFAPLDNDAFEPIAQIPETGFEWVWTGFVSLDFPIGR